ncbi:hypothetical protein A3800_06225 [Streptomyces badius]|nr:SDR family NAD(P)-dependent oxidoreductase [Streptomyces globisporus]RAN16791.1 hypothetical protein A3838_06225 [Streptomyces badius]RAN24657.1 hypothetical protein A3800_06225 [Streptomyces badius]WSF75945.1 SDR family NAD(P)-dependent oxidoreductase [Streptomyces globisporus]WSQ91035.1 SDR family NAD(P)-dependent oxidoreductase [Streptomyces globisporus]WSV89035.1 SDR family NAD(P)-dependent oxidoreductase [Streptomyces globisporus]
MTRIALITGTNRGLGRSTALHLAAAGTDLILTYRSHAEEAQAVVEEARKLGRAAVALRLDTGDTATFPDFTAQVRARRRLPQRLPPSPTHSSVAGLGHR